jgi:hypothetical protein
VHELEDGGEAGRLAAIEVNEAGGPDNIACVVADVVETRPGFG